MSAPPRAVSAATPLEVDLAYLERYGSAWNEHDVDAILAQMTEDCVFQASIGPDEDGARHVGRAAVRRGIEAFFAAWPDAHFEPLGAFIAGERGVSEWRFTATREDGVGVRVLGCDLFTFEGGRIKVKNAFRKQRP
jgi:hypothetical protein